MEDCLAQEGSKPRFLTAENLDILQDQIDELRQENLRLQAKMVTAYMALRKLCGCPINQFLQITDLE